MIEARESDISGYIYTITYGNQTNKAGIANYAIEDILFDYQTAYYAGLLGKPCALENPAHLAPSRPIQTDPLHPIQIDPFCPFEIAPFK